MNVKPTPLTILLTCLFALSTYSAHAETRSRRNSIQARSVLKDLDTSPVEQLTQANSGNFGSQQNISLWPNRIAPRRVIENTPDESELETHNDPRRNQEEEFTPEKTFSK